MGLHRAWPDAEIIGVDIVPQPRYPFEFVHADAMMFPLEGYDFIWASPPCQKYSKTAAFAKTKKKNPDLVARTRERLTGSCIPFVIENVPGAPLRHAVTLCGTMFGLGVIRHRNFEASFRMLVPSCGRHGGTNSHRGYGVGGEAICVAGNNYRVAEGAPAMGIDWMIRRELNQAIPPAYSEFIARQFSTMKP
jgi:DNA (cytosine-5)-methyltransferase 1